MDQLAIGQTAIQVDSTQFFGFSAASVPSDVQFRSALTNLSADTILLRWTVETGPNWPANWDVYVADHNFAYVPGTATSPVATTIMPGDSGLHFSSGVFFNGTPGCVEYQVILSDFTQDSVIFDTISYALSINDPTCALTSIEPALKTDLQIFPNPTSDYFSVQSSMRYKAIKCYDLLGRELISWPRTASERYDLSQLVSGPYWLLIEVEEGRFVTHKIIKH